MAKKSPTKKRNTTRKRSTKRKRTSKSSGSAAGKGAGKGEELDPSLDPLTGVLRREVWLERFEAAIHAALTAGRPLAIGLIDVDGFARLGEELEEDRADALLADLGERLRESLPELPLGRLAGDLFAALLADVELEDALTRVGAARVEVLSKPFRVGRGVRKRDVKPGLSVGLAGLRRDGRTASELLGRAQGALWRAKDLGGDRLGLPSKERMVLKSSYYSSEQLDRLKQLAARRGVKESVLLREALSELLLKYKGRKPG